MRAAYIVMAVVLSGCGSSPETDAPVAAPHDLTLTDTNPAPGIVEVSLIAGPAHAEYLPGKMADVWAYRDGARAQGAASIPGPRLEAKVGDRVVVHFKNELSEPTTIHWHGLRVPNRSDGTPSAQAAVPPGGSFQYEFTAEDAGLFWYHPHVHGDVQVENGLYGAIVVRAASEPKVDADRVFVLDDVKLEATGKLSQQTDPLDMMLGRQGNVLIVNGKTNGSIDVRAGARERWRFVNSANGRYFNLALPGHSFLVIGWDGGLLAEPYSTEHLLIAPGERYEVLVTLDGKIGSTLALQTLHYDRGHEVPDPGPQEILGLRLKEQAPAPGSLPSRWASFEALPVDTTTPVRKLVLSEEEAGLAEPKFFINGKQFPDVPALDAQEGSIEIWQIQNDAEMDHPFHLHGMFFQVLDVDGIVPANQGWKDTVNIPQKKTLRFAVRYGTPGRWLYHCHILEHAERGMMAELQVQ